MQQGAAGQDAENAAMAEQAHASFHCRDYQRAFDSLSKIASSNPQGEDVDPRLVHNLALTEHLMGRTSADGLLRVLAQVKARLLDTTVVGGQWGRENELETVTVRYNLAVLLLDAERYREARCELEHVYAGLRSGESGDPAAAAAAASSPSISPMSRRGATPPPVVMTKSFVSRAASPSASPASASGSASASGVPGVPSSPPALGAAGVQNGTDDVLQERGLGLRVCLLLLDTYLAMKDVSPAWPVVDFLSSSSFFKPLYTPYGSNTGPDRSQSSSAASSPGNTLSRRKRSGATFPPPSPSSPGSPPNAMPRHKRNSSDSVATVQNDEGRGVAGDGKDAQRDSATIMSRVEFSFLLYLYRSRLYLASGDLTHARSHVKFALTLVQREKSSSFKQRGRRMRFGSFDASGSSGRASAPSSASAAETPSPAISPRSSATGLEDVDDDREAPQRLSEEEHGTMATLLKAQTEFVQGRFSKALGLLHRTMPMVPETDVARLVFLNNLGCVHMGMMKHAAAGLYFSRALQLREGLVLHATKKRADLLYNCGVHFLATGQPELASRCLRQASANECLSSKPSMWFRLAQSEVLVYQQRQSQREYVRRRQLTTSLQQTCAQSHVHRLHHGSGGSNVGGNDGNDGNDDSGMAGAGGDDNSGPSLAQDLDLDMGMDGGLQLSNVEQEEDAELLGHASMCLKTCLQLCKLQEDQWSSSMAPPRLPRSPSPMTAGGLSPVPSPMAGGGAGMGNSGGSGGGGGGSSTGAGGVGNDSGSGSGKFLPSGVGFLASVKCCSLLHLAYVLLCLEDPVAALQAALEVLRQPSHFSRPSWRLMAHTYAAEALCMLNRSAEAMSHLEPASVFGAGADTSPGASSSPSSPLVTQSIATRCAFFVNKSVVLIARGDNAAARKELNGALELDPAYGPSVRTLAYLELAEGNTPDALRLLECKIAGGNVEPHQT